MNKCLNCGKRVILLDVGKHIHFCDMECLKDWADEYLSDNWRDYAYMMGARVID